MVNIIYIYIYTYLVGGWPTPLKNDGVRQLWWLFPIYGEIKKMSFRGPTVDGQKKSKPTDI